MITVRNIHTISINRKLFLRKLNNAPHRVMHSSALIICHRHVDERSDACAMSMI